MKQYLSLYKQFLSINLSLFMAYRGGFLGYIVVTAVWTFLSLFTMVILTSKAKVVMGWTQAEMLLMAGGLTIVIGAFSFLFKKSFQHLPEIILYGDLDGILLKPIDSQFMISMIYVHFSSLLRVVVGIVFVIYIVLHFNLAITFVSTLMFIALLFFGLMIYYSIWLMAATLLIWFPRISNILELTNSLNHTSRYPPEIYQELHMLVFFFVLPYTLVLSTPVRALVQKASWFDIGSSLVCSVLLFVVSRLFWKFALKSYGSASG